MIRRPTAGDYSLQLNASWLPASGFVWTRVPGVESGDILVASTQMKVTNQNLPALFTLFVGQDPIGSKIGRSKVGTTNSTDWTRLEIVDTIALNPDDSVLVVLQGPAFEVCVG
ncbi:MAG: hypothetical protein GF341_02700, partial [candidate division Zixibacteria bacterium]|nr:hypothetical protein [candidate division Zixibacteria bacterium]